MSLGTEVFGLCHRPQSGLEGRSNGDKSDIDMVQHKRRQHGHPDTQSRIFGGDIGSEEGKDAAGSGQVTDNGPSRHCRGKNLRNPITQTGPGWTSNESTKGIKRHVDSEWNDHGDRNVQAEGRVTRAAAGSGQITDNGPNRHARGQNLRNPISQTGTDWSSNEGVKGLSSRSAIRRHVDRNAHQR